MKAIVGISTVRDVDVLSAWTNAARGVTQVLAVAVVPSVPSAMGALQDVWPNWKEGRRRLTELAQRESESLLRRFEQAVSGSKAVTTEVLHGEPASMLVASARKNQANLITVGSQGPRISKEPRGHVAMRVSRYAKTRVLVVGGSSRPPVNVVYATDGSDASWKAASVLGELSFETLRHITVCSAADPFIPPLHRTGLSAEMMQRLRDELEEAYFAEAAVVAKEAAERVRQLAERVDTEVAIGRPVDAIARVYRQRSADLAIMGAKGASRRLGFLLGSTSAAMLQRRTGSLLLGR